MIVVRYIEEVTYIHTYIEIKIRRVYVHIAELACEYM